MLKKFTFFLGVMGILCGSLHAQVSLTSATGPYSQDFNTLSNTGTSSTLPNGWLLLETGSGGAADNMYVAGTGSGNGGNAYSFGANGSSERALGTLLSGSVTPTIGVAFTNNTGASIATITVSYAGEQWRLGTVDRIDVLDFQYSLNATALNNGTFVNVDDLDFSSQVTTAPTGALDGNDAANRSNISFTITGLAIPNGSTFYFRWLDFNAPGADDGLAIDDFSMTWTTTGGGSDVTPPTVSSLLPSNNATGVAQSAGLQLTFSESIQKGTGDIRIRLASDNSIVQTIPVASAAITVNNTIASIAINTLDPATQYYVEVDAGAFEDLAANDFAGISGSADWTFTTGTTVYGFDFNACSGSLSDGFTQFSVTGAQTWGCTTFGRNGSNGMQMNGFSGGPVDNVDWLISPSLDLTAGNGFTVPLLSFYSRNAFNGPGLELFVSTDYVAGDPTTATWTELNGSFPAVFTDAWTLSDSIDLSAFMQGNVHIAFRYTSSVAEGAQRWTLDDIQVFDAPAPAAPVLTLLEQYIDFHSVNAGGISGSRTFELWADNLSTNLTLAAPTGFELSRDGTSYSGSIAYTPAETVNQQLTVYSRFNPTAASQGFSGYINASSTGIDSNAVFVKGNSIPLTGTLNIVNWNLEWFGASGLGPADDDLQQANAKSVMDYLDADIFAMVEITNSTRFDALVNSLSGSYDYVLGEFCSSGTTAAACANAQKLALVYKTSVVSDITARPLLSSSSSANTNWSNGRFPFLVTATINKNGQTGKVNFIIVHAKAFDGAGDYNQRKGGADELKDTLDAQFSNANVIILGDFNDDMDSTIVTSGISPRLTPFNSIVADSTDADSYRTLTLPLSLAGLHSTYNNSDVIDHVIVSNEMASGYVLQTASLYDDIGQLAGITDFSLTTSDHFPVLTRFEPAAVLPVAITGFRAVQQESGVKISWNTASETNSKEFIIERSADGEQFTSIGKLSAAGNSRINLQYSFFDQKPLSGRNFYRLRQVDLDGKFALSAIASVYIKGNIVISVTPNPATSFVQVKVGGVSGKGTIRLQSLDGRLLRQVSFQGLTDNTGVSTIPVRGLARGTYLVKVISEQGTQTSKLLIR